jgi:hypothetical protein
MDGSGPAPSSEVLTSAMSAHGEGSLCRHSSAATDIETISLTILDPRRRALTVTDGPPCRSPSLGFQL